MENNTEQKEFNIKRFLITVGSIFLVLWILAVGSEGCENKPNDNIYTESDYHQDHPNTDKSWEQWQKEQSEYQKIKEEQERRDKLSNQ